MAPGFGRGSVALLNERLFRPLVTAGLARAMHVRPALDGAGRVVACWAEYLERPI